MPPLVSIVSAWWFSPALIMAGFAYTFIRWTLDENQRGRAYGQLMDRVGWGVVAFTGILVVSTFFFDSFLMQSNAASFAKFVTDQKTERHLSEDDFRKLKEALEVKSSEFQATKVGAPSDTEPTQYAMEFLFAFKQIGLNPVNGGIGEQI
jgi:hypothetical protein